MKTPPAILTSLQKDEFCLELLRQAAYGLHEQILIRYAQEPSVDGNEVGSRSMVVGLDVNGGLAVEGLSRGGLRASA
jgi:hypothetical protein